MPNPDEATDALNADQHFRDSPQYEIIERTEGGLPLPPEVRYRRGMQEPVQIDEATRQAGNIVPDLSTEVLAALPATLTNDRRELLVLSALLHSPSQSLPAFLDALASQYEQRHLRISRTQAIRLLGSCTAEVRKLVAETLIAQFNGQQLKELTFERLQKMKEELILQTVYGEHDRTPEALSGWLQSVAGRSYPTLSEKKQVAGYLNDGRLGSLGLDGCRGGDGKESDSKRLKHGQTLSKREEKEQMPNTRH